MRRKQSGNDSADENGASSTSPDEEAVAGASTTSAAVDQPATGATSTSSRRRRKTGDQPATGSKVAAATESPDEHVIDLRDDASEPVALVDLGDDWTTAELPEESPLFRIRRRLSPGTDHLAWAISDTRRDMLSELERHRGPRPRWLDEAGQHLADATDECAGGHIDAGWRSLRHANRLSIAGASEVGVHARILALRAEAAERVPGWTGAAIHQILDEAAVNQESDERREMVIDAAALRDQSYASTHHQQSRRRREISWSLTVLAASMAVIVALALRDLVDLSGQTIDGLSGWLALSTTLFGLCGASVSAILRVARSTTSAHDSGPDGASRPQSSLLRPAIGALAALVVGVAVAGGAIGPVTATAPLIVALSFVAGFSERLVGP